MLGQEEENRAAEGRAGVTTALVTGGGGFIGTAIVRGLLARGWMVRSLARGDYPELRALGAETVRGDVASERAVSEALRGCDVVFHTAAKAGVWGAAEDYRLANVEGTRNVIAGCRKHGVGRLVHTSSPSVVFDGSDQEGVDESAPYPAPEAFLADYPRTKAEAERMVLAANGPGLKTVALRPHLVWGPGDPHLVPRIVERARAGQLRLVGDPRATEGKPRKVDSTYIDNAAHAHLLAADALATPEYRCAGKAYFISNGDPTPIADLINRILAAAHLPPVTRKVSPGLAYAAGAVLETVYRLFGARSEPRMTRFVARQLATAHWFDLGAAKRDLGYTPQVSFEEGMRRLEASLVGGKAP